MAIDAARAFLFFIEMETTAMVITPAAGAVTVKPIPATIPADEYLKSNDSDIKDSDIKATAVYPSILKTCATRKCSVSL
jgi:hypothetical protein